MWVLPVGLVLTDLADRRGHDLDWVQKTGQSDQDAVSIPHVNSFHLKELLVKRIHNRLAHTGLVGQ